jgi:1-aminocyclopropane-1-carboxylate deaminase/D-cysteine desulfhydrase-like pyridoxal-dependent ACC family enzyme
MRHRCGSSAPFPRSGKADTVRRNGARLAELSFFGRMDLFFHQGAPSMSYLPPLFNQFERLRDLLPFRSVGTFPTPVHRLDGLCATTGAGPLYIKRDDISGLLYGGNKVRKLEFLLADALGQGAVRVLTSGAAGSNHALATALYAKQAGLRATLVLFDQPASPVVCDNLLMDAHTGAEMIHEERYERYGTVVQELEDRYIRTEGRAPYVIPAGGSSPAGVLGYVNAAFELRMQVETGHLPEPEEIFVPFGTMGTVAGLALGLRAAGMKSRIHAVRVVPASIANREKCAALIAESNRLLDKGGVSVTDADRRIVIDGDYFEPGYGLASPRVIEAVRTGLELDGLELDITYSGKAYAAFCAAAQNKKTTGPLLFWDTKNSRPFPRDLQTRDYRELPAAFHRFFTEASGVPGDYGQG